MGVTAFKATIDLNVERLVMTNKTAKTSRLFRSRKVALLRKSRKFNTEADGEEQNA